MEKIGYCTNIHPATSLDAVIQNLKMYTANVRQQVCPENRMSCGLWLNETTLADLQTPGTQQRLKQVCDENRLVVQTLNGFPMGDFHQPVVKQAVYWPDWSDPQRLLYTSGLAAVLVTLLGDRTAGSISTLPLGWRARDCSADFQQSCAQNLVAWAAFARELYNRTGKKIRLALEPEPGCLLDRAADVTEFFENYLRPELKRSCPAGEDFLGVCHDVCHSAVMFEDQADVIAEYDRHGIAVCKVQISSALEADFDDPETTEAALLEALHSFVEPRFLHQTITSRGECFDDLPDAIRQARPEGKWRIHFHVPVFADRLGGGLRSTRAAIVACLPLIQDRADVDLEVETYAWNVLPESLRAGSLVEGISRELTWIHHGVETEWKQQPGNER